MANKELIKVRRLAPSHCSLKFTRSDINAILSIIAVAVDDPLMDVGLAGAFSGTSKDIFSVLKIH